MKRVLATAALVLIVGLTTAISLAAQEKVDSLDQARINRLIHDLGSDNPATREEATQELRNVGGDALPALREAQKSPDAEVSYRAQRLIEEIERRGRPKEEKVEEDSSAPVRPPRKQTSTGFNVVISGNGSFSLQRDPNGHIKLSVNEEKDGQRVDSTYEADSVAEFIERYPEVAQKYGITEKGGGLSIFQGFRRGAGPGAPNGPDMEDLQAIMKQLPDVFRDSSKLMEQILKGLKGLGDENGKDWDESFSFGKDMFPGEDEDDLAAEDDASKEADPPKEKNLRDLLMERLRGAKSQGRPQDGMQVEYISPALRAQLGIEDEGGVQVSELEEGSPAEKAGLRKFDVILTVNGRPIHQGLEFRRALSEAVDGGKLTFDVIRKGKASKIEVTGEALEAFKK